MEDKLMEMLWKHLSFCQENLHLLDLHQEEGDHLHHSVEDLLHFEEEEDMEEDHHLHLEEDHHLLEEELHLQEEEVQEDLIQDPGHLVQDHLLRGLDHQ